MGRILAIDYGTKRTGIAVTDPEKIIATPLTTVLTNILFDFLKDYIAKEPVEKIIVGFPERDHDIPSVIQEKIRIFVEQLKKQLTQEIVMVDERYTSKLAFQSMIDGGLKKKRRRDKAMIDKVSATIILQDYLKTLEQ
jgi:putative Holliday junction resolvase